MGREDRPAVLGEALRALAGEDVREGFFRFIWGTTAAASNERVRPVRTAAVFAFAIPPRDRGGSGLRAELPLRLSLALAGLACRLATGRCFRLPLRLSLLCSHWHVKRLL